MSNVVPPDVVGWVEDYAAESLQLGEIDQLVTIVNDAVTAAVPQLRADEELRRDLDASTRAHWRDFLATVPRQSFEPRPPAEAVDLARTIARRGLELGVLLKVYRVGQRAVWDYLTATLMERIDDTELRARVLIYFWDRVSEWLDTTVEVVVGTYNAEREQWRRGALARRTETVHTILRGDPVDVDAASALLGHPLRLHQTAMVLWAEEPAAEPEVVRALDALAAALADELGGSRPLTVASGARGLWAWVASTRRPDLDALPSSCPDGLRVAVGESARGLAGFRRSHREALAAQRIAVTARTSHARTRYADIELVSLAAADPDAMRTLVTRELAALAARDEATARLRRTTLAFLAHGGNVLAAADRLGVHKNTVRYRIHQAEQLLGHSINIRRTHLELALRCAETYGDTVLPPQSR